MLAGIGEIFQLYQLVREFKIPFGGEWLVCMEQAQQYFKQHDIP